MLKDPGERASSFTFMIHAPGGRFTDAFDAALAVAGIRAIKSPPQAPRANTTCERTTGTLRRESLDRILTPGERHLRVILAEFLTHHHGARLHRALAQLSPHQSETAPPEPSDLPAHRPRRKPIPGGLTSRYQVAV